MAFEAQLVIIGDGKRVRLAGEGFFPTILVIAINVAAKGKALRLGGLEDSSAVVVGARHELAVLVAKLLGAWIRLLHGNGVEQLPFAQKQERGCAKADLSGRSDVKRVDRRRGQKTLLG